MAFGNEDSSVGDFIQQTDQTQLPRLWIYLIIVLNPLFLNSKLMSSRHFSC